MINITDIPIKIETEDKLGIEDYKNALLNYIQNSETPMTISIQGEWGSGKTSIMNMIKTNLDKQKTPTIWINTWEYSMVSEDFAALSVFQSIIDNLANSISENSDKFTEQYKKQIDVVKKSATGLIKGASKLLLSMNLDVNSNSAVDDVAKTLGGASSIGSLKKELQLLVKRILELKDNEASNKKVVLFIDDLDRLNPEIAIKILEILKNVFDLENCLFVLAIDYEVIVKGLNAKFGDRQVNEREYRQFFDKIIQLPFSLPIGRYKSDQYIQDMIAGDKIKYFSKDEFETNKEYLMNIVNYSVGGNPRALKRMANYLSLVNSLLKDSSTDERLVHFSLIAIQIVYPFVYQMLAKNPDFTNWDDESFKLSYFELPEEFKGKEEFNDDWEIEIYKAIKTTKNNYFLERSFDISLLLNSMITKFGSDNIGAYIQKALEVASITSAESPVENSTKPDFSSKWEELSKEIKELKKDGKSNTQTISFSKGYKLRLAINQFSTKITLLVKMKKSQKWDQLIEASKTLPINLKTKEATMDKSFTYFLEDFGSENFNGAMPIIVEKYKVLKDFADKNL